jgi:hypothetical protein
VNRRRVAAVLLALALTACADEDEIDAASADLLAKLPRGSAFSTAVTRIESLGFACNAGQIEFVDKRGTVQRGQPHLRCQLDEPFLAFCTKRTNAILIQRDGRLINVLVNIGRFC